MINYLVACASGSAATSGGCYDWPVIKQIIMLFGYIVEYIYKFLEWIGIPNLGLTIILLTIIVKCILLPLTVNQQKFTKLSSYAQPELKAIQAKYQGRRDSYSMQAMQQETKAVYAKYGISQTGGCLQTFIQMPIIIALYGAIRNIPLYIDSFQAYYQNIINAIGNTDLSTVSASLGTWADLSLNDKITVLYNLPTKGWTALMELFSGDALTTIQTNYEEIHKLNSFCGLDLGETPWNLMIAGGIGILAVFLPLLSGFSQWLSVKLSQAAGSAGQAAQDSMGASMKTMNLMMPLISVFFCFTLPSAIGLYWCVSSLFQVVFQILINKRFRKIDMDEYVKMNMEKAEEKAKRKREKKGVSGTSLSQAANTSTKNMQSQAPSSIKDKANVNVGGNTASASAAPPPANSLAARAALVQKYNEEHGVETDEATGAKHKKYKK